MNGQLSRTEVLVGICLKLVIASCVLGILQHWVDVSQGFMDSIFMAFTTQSNIWAAAICFVFLFMDVVTNGRRGVPRWLYVVKTMATTSVLLTWIAFAVLLSPTVPIGYLMSPSNLCCTTSRRCWRCWISSSSTGSIIPPRGTRCLGS